MITKIWKEIKGYEGLYEISNDGFVKSLVKNKILSFNYNGCKAYKQVQLFKDGKRHTKLIHRLVAEAFIPNPNNLPEVNHKDEDTFNNAVDNLEWCTSKYNANYGTRNIRIAEKTSKPLYQLNKDTGEIIKEWKSAAEVQRSLGWRKDNINFACTHNNTSYGYKWKYIEL